MQPPGRAKVVSAGLAGRTKGRTWTYKRPAGCGWPHEGSDSTIAQIASEVLALTKVNWNSTQMNQKLPIPIKAARAVGEVLKYVTDQKVSSDYARYI
jgi:hypothetical protein